MRDRRRWPKVVSLVGGVSLVAGSLDPMEGFVLILPGSALLALGSYLDDRRSRTVVFRTWGFILVAIGVAALLWLSAMGGVGGRSGHSGWWALLILPYLIGWSIDLWGPGAARWMSIAGIGIGVWYLVILGMMLGRGGGGAQPGIVLSTTIAVVGIATIAACAVRLLTRLDPSDR